MGPTRSPVLLACALAALLGALASGCRLAGAKVWNLEQVHEADGTPKRHGQVQGDLSYLLGQTFKRTNFGGPDYQAQLTKDEAIDDPLGVCLENVIELGECAPDEKVAGLQAAAFGWLAVDCTYVLSRERCVLDLGELARRLQLAENPVPPASDAPATPEVVKQNYDHLIDTVRSVLAQPDLAGHALGDVCDAIRALPLDRPGALRLLRTTNALFEREEGGAVLAPLRALRLELARRVTALALRQARDDPHGRVRAAAVTALAGAFPGERAELLRWALTDPMKGAEKPELPSLAALELLAQYGLPDPPPGTARADFEHDWTELLVQVLRLEIDDPHANAACRALGRITGEPASLRPEVWVARWRAHGGATQQGTSGASRSAP